MSEERARNIIPKPTVRLQFVATSRMNMSAIAALALRSPDQYIGRAGDVLIPRDLEAGWGKVFGVEMRPQLVGGSAWSWMLHTATKDLGLTFKFSNEVDNAYFAPAC
ncbi:hypothetical protein DFH06DRAFT_1337195 [Mycena polygramma]|nr:hypothetical protein DFH06DRAFT_1337195 [Mycena polygramma]